MVRMLRLSGMSGIAPVCRAALAASLLAEGAGPMAGAGAGAGAGVAAAARSRAGAGAGAHTGNKLYLDYIWGLLAKTINRIARRAAAVSACQCRRVRMVQTVGSAATIGAPRRRCRVVNIAEPGY
jgi:hypothetical protein